MKVKFIFNEIRDMSKLYKVKQAGIPWGNEGTIIQYDYCGTKYCDELWDAIKTNFPEVNSYIYSGQVGRVANEMYFLKSNHREYEVEFTIDTYEHEKAKMMVTITTNGESDGEEYDIFLEKLKLSIKDTLKKDWNSCIWILDEQSQYLCSKLYVIIFDLENGIRAFANRVLMHRFGVEWLKQVGLEKFFHSHKELSKEFKRQVPCFADIDDTFISMTMETMFEVILKAKVFQNDIMLNNEDYKKIHTKIAENNANSLIDFFREKRTVVVDFWEDIFKKYFSPEEDAKKEITNFIKNRNHVAHNKLLDWNAYKKMEENMRMLQEMIDSATMLFEVEIPSEEQYMTWEAMEDAARTAEEEEEWTRNYLRYRIAGETGVEILDEIGIVELFEESINELYSQIEDECYFDSGISLSKLETITVTEEVQLVFEIESNVLAERKVSIYVEFELDGSMDGDSSMYITCRTGLEAEEICGATVQYHNGSGYEDTLEGVIVLSSESEYDDSKLAGLKKELKEYLAYGFNPLIAELSRLKHEALVNEVAEPVADICCCECGKKGISILESFYPVGHCCFCGTDNDITICSSCGKAFADYNRDGMCKECRTW